MADLPTRVLSNGRRSPVHRRYRDDRALDHVSRNRLPHLGRESFAAPLVFPYEPKQLFGTFFYNDIDEFIVFLAIILCVAVALIIRYTRLGIQMRAVADGPALAAYSGIHVTRISAMAWEWVRRWPARAASRMP